MLLWKNNWQENKMETHYDINEGNLSSLVDSDGWVLGPFKNPMCKTHTENVHMRWCVWKKGEIRNQTQQGRDYDWVESVFLIDGELRVKYENDSVLLFQNGDYATYDSIRWPKYIINRDTVAIMLRWKSAYEGKRYGNVSNYTKFYNNWVVGPFVNKNLHPHFYSDNLEFKWSERHSVPYIRGPKKLENIENYDWKSLCVLTNGRFSIHFGNKKCEMNKLGDYVYWHPNAPHTNYTNIKSNLFTIRWND